MIISPLIFFTLWTASKIAFLSFGFRDSNMKLADILLLMASAWAGDFRWTGGEKSSSLWNFPNTSADTDILGLGGAADTVFGRSSTYSSSLSSLECSSPAVESYPFGEAFLFP